MVLPITHSKPPFCPKSGAKVVPARPRNFWFSGAIFPASIVVPIRRARDLAREARSQFWARLWTSTGLRLRLFLLGQARGPVPTVALASPVSSLPPPACPYGLGRASRIALVSPLSCLPSPLLYLRTGTGACPYDCACFSPLPSPVSRLPSPVFPLPSPVFRLPDSIVPPKSL